MFRTEDISADDSNHLGMNDTRHIPHDDRLIPTNVLRRRLTEIGKNNIIIHLTRVPQGASCCLVDIHENRKEMSLL